MLLRNLIRFNCLALISFFISSCNIVNSDIPVNEIQNKSESKIELVYGETILQSTSNYAIIPLGFSSDDSYKLLRIGSSDNLKKSQSQIWQLRDIVVTNLIFHHQKEDNTHLLLNHKAIISRFDYLNPHLANENNKNSCYVDNKDSLVSRLFIYQIIEQDTNKDTKLDSKDADRGYISDLSGKKLRPITPETSKLVRWDCDLARNQLILFVREDLNQNKYFTPEDPLVPYLYNLTNNTMSPIIPEKTSLSKWTIDFNLGQIFLEIKQDSNRDQQFTDEDKSTILKVDLAGKSETKKVINDDIRSQIKSLNKK